MGAHSCLENCEFSVSLFLVYGFLGYRRRVLGSPWLGRRAQDLRALRSLLQNSTACPDGLHPVTQRCKPAWAKWSGRNGRLYRPTRGHEANLKPRSLLQATGIYNVANGIICGKRARIASAVRRSIYVTPKACRPYVVAEHEPRRAP